MNDKITSKHTQRAAYVYIRQSTLQQVRHNVESNRRQYELQNRARELGFKEVAVVDDDLGISGTGSSERPGFSRLLAAVCNGEVGGVLALEASRLARNNRDWHHLIDLCVLTETLVIDDEGIYDPRQLNDRLLLGLKGTMSEFELGILRQRAQEAYRHKVMRGEVLTRVPIGFVRKGSNGIEITPDRGIQEAIRNVFFQFDRLGTLRQALLWYHDEKVLFPAEHRRDGVSGIEWQLPNYQQLLRVIKNPTYAGAFAWGRTGTRSEVVDGRSRKTLGHHVPMQQWQVLIKDHHPGYIAWDKYMENNRKLESNKSRSHQTAPGAPKGGSALLAGLLRCARCGHKLHVGYRSAHGRAPRYYCLTGNKEQGKPSCLSFGGVRVENAIVDLVLKTCQPIAVRASLAVFEGSQSEHDQKRRALELALERAKYEAERARRQYDAVDPDNRLVAAELEERWNAALQQVAETEDRLRCEQARSPLDESQRNRLLALGENLEAVWSDPASPNELKKRILRTVINEVIVDIDHEAGFVQMQVHWAGGVHTPLRAAKNKKGVNRNAGDKSVVELVRKLATGWRDSYIANILNKAGLQTGKSNSWNETRVRHLRNYNKIPPYSESRERVWKTMSEAADKLHVSVHIVRTMVSKKILPATQIAKGTPWIIEAEDLKRGEVLRYAKQARAGRTAPCKDNNRILNPLVS